MLIKFIVQVFFLLFLSVCVQSQTKFFRINGRINTDENEVIYLCYTLNGQKVVDTSRIIKGNFILSGKLNEPVVGYFMIKKGNVLHDKLLNIFLEPSITKIELNRFPFSIIDVSGSRSHHEMTEFLSTREVNNNYFNYILARLKNEKDVGKIKILEDSVLLINREIKQWEYSFFKKHPRSPVTSRFLSQSTYDYSIDELSEIYNGLGKKLQDTRDGIFIGALIENKKSLLAVKEPEPFSCADFITGEPVSLMSMRGKYVLIDFWGTWCVPCLELIPSMVQEYHRYRNKNIQFISIAYDRLAGSTKVRRVVQDNGIIWPAILIDKYSHNVEDNLVDKYSIHIFPTILIIDPHGKIILRGEGTIGFIKAKRLLKQIL